MITVCYNAIFYYFKDESEFSYWKMQQSANALYFVIDPIEYEVTESELLTITIVDLEDPTKKYSERPICIFCDEGPVFKDENNFCPVCSSISIFAQ